MNEMRISVSTVPPTSYVLSESLLEAQLKTICDSINTTYAMYHRINYLHTKSNVIQHLKNTLSDRVAVNHCVVQQLQAAFLK